MIKLERVYDKRSSTGGKHYLVERLPGTWEPILQAARKTTVTLLYSSHDTEHNNAVALKEYLEQNKSCRAARPAHAPLIQDAQKRKSGAKPRRPFVGGRKLKGSSNMEQI